MARVEDRYGHALSGATVEAAEQFDAAVEAYNLFRGDPVGLLDRALARAPDFAMAKILASWLFALTAETPLMAGAAKRLSGIDAGPLTDREALHLQALRLLCRGEWSAAGAVLDRVLTDWPRDIVALQSGHQIDFFRASDRSLRERVARVLPDWSRDLPGYGAVLGMQAFALEENGDYAGAEAAGRAAVALEPRDSWAHHAVAHVMEMQGRADEGLAWMADREAYWADEASFFRIHNWWHRGLFLIESGDPAGALMLYDWALAEPGPLALNLADAASLLWRLSTMGVDPGHRFGDLARSWDERRPGTGSAFLDMHMAMAYLGAGETAPVRDMLARLDALDPGSEAERWEAGIARPLIRGFLAFATGDYDAAADLLYEHRTFTDAFGGSHAQRDVIDWTLTEAALRAGRGGLARALAADRIARRPHSPVNRAFLARATEAVSGS